MSNKISKIFSDLKEKIHRNNFSSDSLKEIDSKIDKLEEDAESLGQIDLLNSLKAQANFNKRLLTDILPKGLDTYVRYNEIEEVVKDRTKEEVRPLVIKRLSEFPRPIPDENKEAINNVKMYFDDIYILFTDYTGKEREKYEKEKDPIAFGVMIYEIKSKDPNGNTVTKRIVSDKLVYITDWEDEYCDLTLDRLLEEFPNISSNKISDIEFVDNHYAEN